MRKMQGCGRTEKIPLGFAAMDLITAIRCGVSKVCRRFRGSHVSSGVLHSAAFFMRKVLLLILIS